MNIPNSDLKHGTHSELSQKFKTECFVKTVKKYFFQ